MVASRKSVTRRDGSKESFSSTNLGKYCVKKIFHICLINEANEGSTDFLDQLVRTNKTYETLTKVAFITYEEIMDFIRIISVPEFKLEFPPTLCSDLTRFSSELMECIVENATIPPQNLCWAIKCKLIQVMYTQYAKKVQQMRQHRQTNDALDELTKVKAEKADSKKGKKGKSTKTSSKKGKKDKSTKSSGKKGKKDKSTKTSGKKDKTAKSMGIEVPKLTVVEIKPEDFSLVPLEDDDITVNDDLFSHIQFYILRGLPSSHIIKYLKDIQVPITSVIQVSEQAPHDKFEYGEFWQELNKLLRRTDDNEFLEDTAIMKYVPEKSDSLTQTHKRENLLKFRLEELAYVIRSVIDMKRQHFKYISYLKLYKPQYEFNDQYYEVYNKILGRYPPECITVPLMLHAILEEVHTKLNDDTTYPYTKKHRSTEYQNKDDKCPFHVESFLNSNKKSTKHMKQSESFIISSNDQLNLMMKTYKQVEHEYIDDNLKILYLQKPCVLVNKYDDCSSLPDDVVHTHSISAPCSDTPLLSDDQIDHLINLFHVKGIKCRGSSGKIKLNNLYTNLCVYDEDSHFKEGVPVDIRTDEVPNNDSLSQNENMYENFNAMENHWVENLPSVALTQSISKDELDFICCDYNYCNVTETLLVRYHNGVSNFGIKTRLWNQSLRTVVCLRDFCRFIVLEDYEWLNKNKPYPQIKYLDMKNYETFMEPTKAFLLNVYPEYTSLLLPQIQYSRCDLREGTKCQCIQEGICDYVKDGAPDPDKTIPEVIPNLQSILEELKLHPNSKGLNQYCRTDPLYYSFNAYDFGPRRFELTGFTNDFFSHDNVRITIDTGRIYTDPFRISANISWEGNGLYIHAPVDNFGLHLVLADRTIVAISRPDRPIREKKEEKSDSESQYLESEGPQNEKISNHESIVVDVNHDHSLGEDIPNEKTVTVMDIKHYKTLNLFPILGSNIRLRPSQLYKTRIDTEIKLLKDLKLKAPFYKITHRKSRKFHYLSKTSDVDSLNLSNIVRRVLNNPLKRTKCLQPRKKCTTADNVLPKCVRHAYDLKITLPNGLTIKSIPSEIRPGFLDVKQYHKTPIIYNDVKYEVYRLFTNNGTAVVRKSDGSMELFISNGKYVKFEESSLVNQEGDIFCKSHHTQDFNVCRKQLIKVIDNNYNDESNSGYGYFASRRGHLNSKSNIAPSCKPIETFFTQNFPFSTASLQKLDGDTLTLRKGKLIHTQSREQETESDLRAEETLFQRGDGFRSLLDKEGNQSVQFPDGTIITSILHEDRDLLFFDKHDKMGWISIKITFKFEHPYYVPVLFDSSKGNAEIIFGEGYNVNLSCSSISSNLQSNVNIVISTDEINFKKGCNDCKSEYICKLNVTPLYFKQKLELTEEFIVAKDSYNKIFTSDFSGKCRRNNDYLTGTANKFGCKHSLKNDYQKVYLIKKDLSGKLLWDDKMLLRNMKEAELDDTERVYQKANSNNDVLCVKFLRDVTVKYDERFLCKHLLQKIVLSRDISTEAKPIVYQIARSLFSMFQTRQVEGLMKIMKNFLKEDSKSVGLIVKSLSDLMLSVQKSKSIYTVVREKVIHVEKLGITIEDKLMEFEAKRQLVKEIMRRPFPPYFKSAVCTFTK